MANGDVIARAFVEIMPQLERFAQQLKGQLDGATAAIDQSLGQRLQRAGKQVNQFGQQVSAVGSTLTRSLTVPLVGVGTAGTKMALDFGASMTKITALVGVPREQVNAWEGDVRQLARTFGKSGTEAADALFFITSAGLEGDDAMQALEASLKASAVGLGETKVIADLTTSAMNAYKDAGLTASDATDTLTAAVREGKLEPAELAGAMGQTLPIASAMGVSFDEVGAAFAAMSRTGTGASEAATQLRGILTSILKPSQQAEEALSGMGLSAEGLRDQIREEGLLATLETLTEKFDGNDAAAAEVFGNVRALSGVMDLMGGNAAATGEVFASLEDRTGSLGAAFDATSEDAAFQFQQAMATIKDSLLTVGQIIAPVFVDLANQFAGLVDRFRTLSPETQRLIVIIGGIVAAIGPVVFIVGKLISSFGLLISAIGFFLTPVGAVVAIVAALAAGFVILFQRSETFRAAVMRIVEVFKGFIPTIQAIGTQFMEVLRPALATLGPLLEELVVKFAEFFEFISPLLNFLIEIIGSALVGAFQGLVNVIKGVFNIIIGILDVFIGIFTGNWSRAWDGVKSIFSGIWNVIKGVFQVIWNVGILRLLKVGIGIFKAIWSGLWSLIKRLASAGWNGIKSIFSGGISGVVGFLRSLPGRALSAIRSLLSRIGSFFRSVMSRARSAVSSGASGLVGFVRGIPGRILSALGNLGRLLFQAGKNVIQGLIDGVKAMIGKIGDAIGGVASTIRDFLPFSPAKVGPLSGAGAPDKSGMKIVDELSKGIISAQPRLEMATDQVIGAALIDRILGRDPTAPTVTQLTGTRTTDLTDPREFANALVRALRANGLVLTAFDAGQRADLIRRSG